MFEAAIERVSEIFERMSIGMGIGANVVDDSKTFTITVKAVVIPPPTPPTPPPTPPPAEEGKGAIVSVTAPSSFTPGDTVDLIIRIINNGGTDDMFIRVKNKDTGAVIADRKTVKVAAGGSDVWVPSIKITQTTDFHGTVEVGHVA
jgi:hypothetical protein